ncbi:MAG: DUF5131 family protein [Pseudomonadota bacterium]
MNRQGPGKIDWCDYSFNPISGCLHGCPYCYMRRIDTRFPGTMAPAFHPERLKQPQRLKSPAKIFTGSSGDMWGEWVPERWINQVLDAVRALPRHTFQFLTKNPSRYSGFNLPSNGWYGTTVDGTERTENNLAMLLASTILHGERRFVSFEPLLAVPANIDLAVIDWVIIGADSTRGAARPPEAWADAIIESARDAGAAVWIKDNYQYPGRVKEFPQN